MRTLVLVLAAAAALGTVTATVARYQGPEHPEPAGPAPLVTGRLLTPEGAQTPVGSFPANMLLSPDGRYLVVTNTGARQQLSVLSAADGRLVSRREYNRDRTDGSGRREGLYYGLALGPGQGGS